MQQSLSDFVAAMDKAGFLVRVSGETCVDRIPKIIEANPSKAVLVEMVKDSEFSVLANVYSNQDMFAWAMGCDKTRTDLEMVERSKGRIKWGTVTTAPCKEVTLKDDEVDLTPPAPVPPSRPPRLRLYQRQPLHRQASRHRRLRLGHLPLNVPVEEREVGRL